LHLGRKLQITFLQLLGNEKFWLAVMLAT
jgi:hypothetical protein